MRARFVRLREYQPADHSVMKFTRIPGNPLTKRVDRYQLDIRVQRCAWAKIDNA